MMLNFHDDVILALASEFLNGRKGPPIDYDNLPATYTRSPAYLVHLIGFHVTNSKRQAMQLVADHLKPGEQLIDVGCAAGFTGLVYLLNGWAVDFHDYEGLGLEFVRWFCERQGLTAAAIPYGQRVADDYDWGLAFDVIEHTHNHLGFLRWMKTMARTVAFTHPVVPFHPPHQVVLDEWIDSEGVLLVIEDRHEVLLDRWLEDRRIVIYR